MKRTTIGIGELSRQTGCHIETIRYYERIGLIDEPRRTQGGHRNYVSGDVQALQFVVRARELGFSIADIRQLLDLSHQTGTCAQVRELTLGHVAEIKKRIADLSRLQVVLQTAADKCTGHDAPPCPVIDVLSLVD